MKKYLVLGLFVCQGAQAGMCAQFKGAVQDAQASVQKMQSLYRTGQATSYDVLMAQKHVWELMLCKDSNDYPSYKALADNTVNRLHLIQSSANHGAATKDDVDLVGSEVAGMTRGCVGLLESVKNQYNSGMKTSQDVAVVQNACDILNGN